MALIEFSEVATRYTPDEYEALEGDERWADRRVELIHGVILEMSPESEPHAAAIDYLHDWLDDNIDRQAYRLRLNSSFRTSDSEPEPDLMVFANDRPKGSLPSRAVLVIEVAVTSLRRDMQTKPPIYAEGVTEYWVVKPGTREVVVHRDPSGDRYATITTHGPAGTLAPQDLPVVEPLALDALFSVA